MTRPPTRSALLALAAAALPLLAPAAAPAQEGVPAEDVPAGPARDVPAGVTPIDLGFEASDGASLELDAVVVPGGNHYHYYTEDGQTFDMPSAGGALDPVLTTEQHATGERSLKLECAPNDGKDRDRIEFRVKQGNADAKRGRDAFRFGDDRWYGAKIYIDPITEPPTPDKWIHVSQLWQPHTIGGPAAAVSWGVPMAMSFHPVKPGDPKVFDLYAVAKSDGDRSQFELGTLAPGRWHEITFNTKLANSKSDGKGHFRIWIDGKPVINEAVNIGNYPREDPAHDFVAGDSMDVRFGIYRKAQQTTTRLYLDDVWFDDKPHSPDTKPLAATPAAGGDAATLAAGRGKGE